MNAMVVQGMILKIAGSPRYKGFLAQRIDAALVTLSQAPMHQRQLVPADDVQMLCDYCTGVRAWDEMLDGAITRLEAALGAA